MPVIWQRIHFDANIGVPGLCKGRYSAEHFASASATDSEPSNARCTGFGGEVTGSYGNLNTEGGSFYVTGGITPTLAADLSAAYTDQRDPEALILQSMAERPVLFESPEIPGRQTRSSSFNDVLQP
jgi:hypothetical protein